MWQPFNGWKHTFRLESLCRAHATPSQAPKLTVSLNEPMELTDVAIGAMHGAPVAISRVFIACKASQTLGRCGEINTSKPRSDETAHVLLISQVSADC